MPWRPVEGPACPLERPNSTDQRAPTWPALYNIPLLDRSFAGRRDDKTFTIHGESAAASEGRRYIVMDKSMHVSRSTRGSAMAHVVSVRGRPILLACARGEHRYVSDIWLKRNAPLLLHTLVSRPTSRGVAFIGLRTRFVQRGRRAGCVSCCEKHHSCSLLRVIHSYAFLMQPAIFPRSSEARVDNPTLHDSPHTLS